MSRRSSVDLFDGITEGVPRGTLCCTSCGSANIALREAECQDCMSYYACLACGAWMVLREEDQPTNLPTVDEWYKARNDRISKHNKQL